MSEIYISRYREVTIVERPNWEIFYPGSKVGEVHCYADFPECATFATGPEMRGSIVVKKVAWRSRSRIVKRVTAQNLAERAQSMT